VKYFSLIAVVSIITIAVVDIAVKMTYMTSRLEYVMMIKQSSDRIGYLNLMVAYAIEMVFLNNGRVFLKINLQFCAYFSVFNYHLLVSHRYSYAVIHL